MMALLFGAVGGGSSVDRALVSLALGGLFRQSERSPPPVHTPSAEYLEAVRRADQAYQDARSAHRQTEELRAQLVSNEQKTAHELQKMLVNLNDARRRADASEAIIKKTEEDKQRAARALVEYPRPAFMASNGVYIGVVGESGAGKSALINRLTNAKRGDPHYAETGVVEQTMVPKQYRIPGTQNSFIVDCPGIGTLNFPPETYMSMVGLRHMDMLIVVAGERYRRDVDAIVQLLVHHKAPGVIVRSKLDSDVINAQRDNPGISAFDVKARILQELRKYSKGYTVLVVSSVEPACHGSDFSQLQRAIEITLEARINQTPAAVLLERLQLLNTAQ